MILIRIAYNPLFELDRLRTCTRLRSEALSEDLRTQQPLIERDEQSV